MSVWKVIFLFDKGNHKFFLVLSVNMLDTTNDSGSFFYTWNVNGLLFYLLYLQMIDTFSALKIALAK